MIDLRKISVMLAPVLLTACAATMPTLTNEQPLQRIPIKNVTNIAVSTFHVKEGGGQTYVNGAAHYKTSLGVQVPGSEAPIATQTVTDELRGMGFNILKVGGALITPRMMEKLDYIVAGTVTQVYLTTYGHFAGQHTETQVILALDVLDAQTGETVWEASGEGQAAIENDPPVYNTWGDTRAGIAQNSNRAYRIAIQNAFRKVMREQAPELLIALQQKGGLPKEK